MALNKYTYFQIEILHNLKNKNTAFFNLKVSVDIFVKMKTDHIVLTAIICVTLLVNDVQVQCLNPS